MQCPSCKSENPDGMKFCGACGGSLAAACPGCGFPNPPGFKFCGQCGAELEVPRADPRQDQTSTAERRQLTVMFCDLVGSTKLSSQLDPEDLREIICDYQAACGEVVTRFEGHIAQYLGDGLLVYFGYPRAHEDDARRAIQTGLDILDTIAELNVRLEREKKSRLSVRIGIHTGLVVVGEIGGSARSEQLALGQTPNVAARIEGTADPDTVAISAATYKLVQGFFTLESLGTKPLKGVARPMAVYRVLRPSGAQGRLDIAARGLTPLVGRESEVALLLDRWAMVEAGNGQVVIVSGDAGIGKSRLVEVLKEHVANRPHERISCHCSPHFRNTAFYPLINLLERQAEFQPGDSGEEKLRKLERHLERSEIPTARSVPLFALLLSLPLQGSEYQPLSDSPQRQRQETLEMVLTLFIETARHRPLLLLFEDLHWTDPSTLELLHLLIDGIREAPIFLLLACRPRFQVPWQPLTHLTHIAINRLPRSKVKRMILDLTGGKSLPAEVTEQLIAKSDGVPLFVEELTKTILELELLEEKEDRFELIGSLPDLEIPSTLHDSLMARLDRLVSAKAIAQLGATIGREFFYELLQAITQMDDANLQGDLEQLISAGLLYKRGTYPEIAFVFKHALLQEAAYTSLLKSSRVKYHKQIAQVLIERFPDTAETQPELLAHHLTEATMIDKAGGYWQRAGERATQRSAHLEAIAHLRKGLTLLEKLDANDSRARRKLALLTRLRLPLAATRGLAAPELEELNAQTRDLISEIHIPALRLGPLAGLWSFYLVRADLDTALDLAKEVLEMDVQRPGALGIRLAAARQPSLWGLIMVGHTQLYLGQLEESVLPVEQAHKLYDPHRHRPQVTLFQQDPGVMCLSDAALASALLGHPDKSRQRCEASLELARRLEHPYTLVWALVRACEVSLQLGEPENVYNFATEARSIAQEYGFVQSLALADFLREWHSLTQGGELATAELRRSLERYRATGAQLMLPFFLALLAQAHGRVGEVEQGLEALSEASEMIERTSERISEAEIHRLRGELLILQASGDGAEAERSFERALEVARRQKARSLELRVALALCRLWCGKDRSGEAQTLLSTVYGQFDEGLETADLADARALLREMA